MGKIALLSMLLVLAACQTTGGSFCGVARAIRPSKETIATLTDAEVAAILAHNLKGRKLCHWKP